MKAKNIIKEAYEMLYAPHKNYCEPNLSNEDYHANKLYISRSAIMDFDKSPFTYWAKHLNPDRPKKDTTPQMQLGSAFHTLMLEPNKFEQEYAILPPKVLLKNVGRETYDAFKKREAEIAESNKIILTDDEFLNLANMRFAFERNYNAMKLIEGARIENSFFWQDEHSGLLLKARPDILHDNIIVDLKTTSDASPRAFQNEMVKYGYHIQMAMIRDAVEAVAGRRISNFINLVIETKYPYNMAIYMIDECAVDEGQFKYKNILLEMNEAIKKDKWIDYGVQTIGLPKWAT